MNPLENRLIAPAVAAVLILLSSSLHSRTWTSADGVKTFEGELQSYDAASGKVSVILPNHKRITFKQEKLSADDIAWLEKNGNRPAGKATEVKELPDELPDPDGKEADMSKPVQVYILLGQSNMIGFGKPSKLQGIAAEKYPYLVDDADEWTVRRDVRNVFVMCSGNSPAKDHKNEWMTISGNIGPEIGIGHHVGHVTDAPVLILKSCIGNRSLGWDLLPPGSKPYEHGGKTQPGYRGTPDEPDGDTGGDMSKGWYAGCQYDGDVAAAKKALENLDDYYPGAKDYEVAGFFWWQGDKDMRNAAHFEKYEENLIQLIKSLRKDFDAPGARFVTASLGQTQKGSKGGDGKILDAMEAVAKSNDPELEDKVAFVYTHPLSKGGSSSGHYGGNPETYMNVGEAMGKAMVELLQQNR
ncbi:MAG: sialate O-acetylesterase [Roseibacillus sp.]|nr:sialate O-acetylesterase [Roseibacillus sp.]